MPRRPTVQQSGTNLGNNPSKGTTRALAKASPFHASLPPLPTDQIVSVVDEGNSRFPRTPATI